MALPYRSHHYEFESSLRDVWESVQDESGQFYFWNLATDETSWVKPTSGVLDGSPVRTPPPRFAKLADDQAEELAIKQPAGISSLSLLVGSPVRALPGRFANLADDQAEERTIKQGGAAAGGGSSPPKALNISMQSMRRYQLARETTPEHQIRRRSWLDDAVRGHPREGGAGGERSPRINGLLSQLAAVVCARLLTGVSRCCACVPLAVEEFEAQRHSRSDRTPPRTSPGDPER